MSNENEHDRTPQYKDKEERRLIILQSMDNLIKFHEVERLEKHNTLKFYAVFLGGGLSLVFGMVKFSFGIKSAILEIIAITVILLINFLAIKKLLSVRGASNNIYHEYGKRMRFLLNSHTSDLDIEGNQELDYAFKKYIDTQKSGDFLPKHSADTYEIYGFYWLNILFSTSYIIPLVEVFKYFGILSPNEKIVNQIIDICNSNIFPLIVIQGTLIYLTYILGKFIIGKHLSDAPNIQD